jgi:hypothetical protein
MAIFSHLSVNKWRIHGTAAPGSRIDPFGGQQLRPHLCGRVRGAGISVRGKIEAKEAERSSNALTAEFPGTFGGFVVGEPV